MFELSRMSNVVDVDESLVCTDCPLEQMIAQRPLKSCIALGRVHVHAVSCIVQSQRVKVEIIYYADADYNL